MFKNSGSLTKLNILARILKLFKMERKGIKTTTYSLDWDTIMNLESRLLRDFQNNKTKDRVENPLNVTTPIRSKLTTPIRSKLTT